MNEKLKRIANILFSMSTSVVLLVIFAISIGYATFIESKQSTEVARNLIYNALWFEILLGLLIFNLAGNVFKYEIVNKQKFSILIFHFAFVVILIGAAVTRYFGSEGIMHIREGESSNEISIDGNSLRISATAGSETNSKNFKTEITENTSEFSEQLKIADKTVQVDLVSFVPNSVETIVPDATGEAALSLFTMNADNNGTDFILLKGETRVFENISFAFEDTTTNADIIFYRKNGELVFKNNIALSKTSMMQQTQQMLMPNSEQIAEQKTIYRTENLLFVLKTYLENARKNITQLTPEMNKSGVMMSGKNALIFNVSDGEMTQRIQLLVGNNENSTPAKCTLGNVNISIEYGALTQKLPFSIQLKDFKLERYAGSNSPSSYSSEIIVNDPTTNTQMPYSIYMNNILKYNGYRFFQSSYDTDEGGTILSVSNDYWGTTITYWGYFLLIAGMLLTMFNKNSRFRTVLRFSNDLHKKRNRKILTMLAIISFSTLNAAVINKKTHIESLNNLLIQDAVQGRIEPFNTYASDVFRKINKSDSYNNMSATEVILGMTTNSEKWQNEPIIKVANDDLAKELGAVKNYISFNQVFDFDNGGAYRLSEKVDAVYKKEQTTRNKYDKELINLDERINICYQIFSAELLHLFPSTTHINAKWLAPSVTSSENNEAHACTRNKMGSEMPAEMMEMMSPNNKMPNMNIAPLAENAPTILFHNYVNAVNQAYVDGSWEAAESALIAIKNYQKINAGNILPNPSRIQLEIQYNNINIFGKLGIIYVSIGLILLVFYFYQLFNTSSKVQKLIPWMFYVFILIFAIYTSGLAARWYISGHAPWSNGYETMLFVGWAAALSGLIFARRSPVSLAVTGILSAIALFVASMSWMNPEITNLVPVLKSYWLIIHVAVITSSYGFLAMGALLGLLNLILIIVISKQTKNILQDTIQEITYIIELSIYIGLVLLTAGCFIGGVWANESWGRYWGWDPKETWALVSILVYSAILHLRNVPKLNNRFVLSTLALLGFSTIIMTFFGVNYYLSGMHSYGQGTPPPIPGAVYFVLLAIAVIIGWAYSSEKKLKS